MEYLHYVIITGIIIAIIAIQIWLFRKTYALLKQFRCVFSDKDAFNENEFYVERDEDDVVCGINDTRKPENSVLSVIIESINLYLSKNKASVTDFPLLKDIVDRNCDSKEVEIATLMPLPLYLGLVGTMAGIIFGIFFIWVSGGLDSLLIDSSTSAEGIKSLLACVGIAMISSIVGIGLTTLSSYMFKEGKKIEEESKNGFLSWVQANLLPELNTNPTEVLSKTIKQFKQFNKEFATNTQGFKDAIAGVADSYSAQAAVIEEQAMLIKDINKLNLPRIAKSNESVLKEFNDCMPNLQNLGQYLSKTQDYLSKIEELNEQVAKEMDRTHVLEKISDLFERELSSIDQRKKVITESVANVDDALNKAYTQLSDSSAQQIKKMEEQLMTEQESFQKFLSQMAERFKNSNDEMQASLTGKLNETPKLFEELNEVSKIPQKVQEMITSLDKSNTDLKMDILSTNAAYSSELRQIKDYLEIISNKEEKEESKLHKFSEKVLLVSGGLLGIMSILVIIFLVLKFFGN